MKVLCIGHASYDISMLTESFPKENTKNRLKEKIECSGGPALTASLLLGKWEVETYYSGQIGNDTFGEKILETLKKHNVNSDYVFKTGETTKTFILINKENASRTLFNVTEKENLTNTINYNFTPDIILMDGEHFNLSIDAINKFPNAIKVVDAGKVTNEINELSKLANYIVCSKEYAENLTNVTFDYDKPETLKIIMEKMKELYKGEIIITQEDKGSLYKIGEKIKLMSAIKVPAKDTTAAGDIFHGAFVYGLSKKLPLEKCLKIANIAAGLSVKEIGAENSIPEVEEVYKIYEKNR